jgi:hypothetical protein
MYGKRSSDIPCPYPGFACGKTDVQEEFAPLKKCFHFTGRFFGNSSLTKSFLQPWPYQFPGVSKNPRIGVDFKLEINLEPAMLNERGNARTPITRNQKSQ